MSDTSDIRAQSIITLSGTDLSLLEKIEALPTKPGVYQFKNVDGKVIYVGKAQNLRNRVRQYFHKSRPVDLRIDAMISKIVDVELTVTDSEIEALILEANLIKQLKPRYNVLLKDDKSYPYIAITKEPFPRMYVTRRKTSGARYFGPYTDVKSMRHALKTMRNLFMVRSCSLDLTEDSIKKKKFRVCLDFHIKKCEGPCEAFVSQEHYNALIDQASQVLRGKTKIVIESLKKEMDAHADASRFEEAAIIRDRLNTLSVYSEKQKIVDATETDRDIIALVSKEDDACAVIFKIREGKMIGSQHLYLANASGKPFSELLEAVLERYYLEQEDIPPELFLSDEMSNTEIIQNWLENKSGHSVNIQFPKSGDKVKLVALVRTNAQFWLDELELLRLKRGEIIPHSVIALQRDLRLPAPPRRIECFDISNIQGSDTVASLVVFEDGKPKKSEYRKFRIRTVEGPNDFASMHEVVERRYTRILQEKRILPDLIMVDGGKGQLSSAIEVLHKLELTAVPIIGLAKRLEEVFLPNQDESLQLPRTSSGLRLMQQMRDEAHRFAITFHRSVRSKRIIQTELDMIQGVGKKRAEKLLETLGSLQGVRVATEEQLTEIVGKLAARNILKYFTDSESNTSVDSIQH
ncbi:MAG: excinuclease ABC subunit UvrC [Ignavibacteriales bacterium]|nr:excinuclease ABC subunit UvrC [Ignavibacteriales bacterium]